MARALCGARGWLGEDWEGVLKTWKASKDPRYAAKKARIEQLYAIADREITPADGDPQIVFRVDEFGPLNLQPRPGRHWAAVSGKGEEPGRAPRPRMRATHTRTARNRHLFAALELGEDKLYGHIKPRKTRARFLEFCRYLRSLYPVSVRIAIICDNFSPHLTTRRDARVGTWAAANNVEIAYTPTNSSWLNRIEAQFRALRYFTLDGTDHASHKEQASTIRRYIIWRNNHAYDERLRLIAAKANVALYGSRSRRRRWPGVCGGLCRWTARPPHAGPDGPRTPDIAKGQQAGLNVATCALAELACDSASQRR